jgi:hypothetical protein
MINLGITTPLLFEENLIISFAKDWINQFSEIPKFNVMINNNGKLCLTSIDSITKREKIG